ncbi:hypothetical protein BHE74_00050586 [Ensete ventricosum]|nr:hypothetical protein GW17_00040445 [Ensete ventricosum]RWW43719.1 hypothetical protein BHE74_00050586 [Ensete ventricosum]
MQFRSIPPDTGGTYRSTRLPVYGPLATEQYRQNRPSAVDFSRRWSIEGEKGKKKKKKRKRRKKKRRRREKYLLTHAPSPPLPTRNFSTARGDEMSPARGERSRRHRPSFLISTCTARYRRYIPVRQVTGTRTARYRAVLSKIDRRRPILKEIDRQRSTE